MILEDLLEDFELETAANGAEALEKIDSFHPDLVLLDVMMPGVNGYEVCRQIRQNPGLRFVKVLFVSAKATMEERLRGYKEGGDDYITKPFDFDELLAKVNVFLRLNRAEELNQLKTHFLTLIQRETQTPLTGIIGLTDLVLEDDDLSQGEIRESCREVHRCGVRLHDFLEKAVLLCHLKGITRVEKRSDSLRLIVESALHSLEDEGSSRGVRFDVNVADKALYCDSPLLCKAIRLVLGNAVRYSPDGGVVTVQGCEREGSLLLSISDEGCGIGAWREDEIFADFSAQDLARHFSGQGLSLAIARRILELHGGGLGLGDEESGTGAQFVFDLPCSAAVEVAEESGLYSSH